MSPSLLSLWWLLWQWLEPKTQRPFLNIFVMCGQCIFTSVICMELLPLSNLKPGTFYFKMTLQVLLCDIHFNSTLILHNSHMIQCVCFMRQTWHMKIENRFLVWNTERNCRGKRKKNNESTRPVIRVEGRREEKTGWDIRVISSCPEWKQLSSVWQTIHLHKFTAEYNWTVLLHFRTSTGNKDCCAYGSVIYQ